MNKATPNSLKRHRIPKCLNDAAAVWHMADFEDSTGKGNTLVAVGNVTAGIPLKGEELKASLERGGDGRVARFDSGYLRTVSEEGLDISGGEMSLCLRIKTFGSWNFPLIGKYGGDANASYYLCGIDGAKKPMYVSPGGGNKAGSPFRDLFDEGVSPKFVHGSTECIEFVWGSTPDKRIIDYLESNTVGEPMIGEVRNGVMKVNYPAAPIGLDTWHDIIVRFTGPKLQLFIDGVLVDEEFPVGDMRKSGSRFLIGAAMQDGEIVSGFRGLIDHAALWNRALSDGEIEYLSGGPAVVERRDVEILGKVSDRLQYWRPRGHNTRAGDCMPFFHDGVFHLYFLVVRRNHHGKWQAGHGGLEVWHASTRDLVHWEHHPVAVPITEQWEMWWGTGSFVHRNGRYYTLQKCPHMWETTDEKRAYRNIQLATSDDGVHFVKNDSYPFLEGEDVDIFFEEETGLYHLLTGKKLKPGEKPTIKRLVSRNLLEWEEVDEPFIVTDHRFRVNICPHLFKWKGWYYFFGGFTKCSGVWRSKELLGPWILQKPERLDLLAVPKTAEFPGDRRIFAGFLEDHGWGGNLIFRDLVQNEDGSLGTKFPPEMVPECGGSIAVEIEAITPGVSAKGSTVGFTAEGGRKLAMVSGLTGNMRVRLSVHPTGGEGSFGLYLKGRNADELGFELRFEPENQRVSFADDPDLCIEDVAGLDARFDLDIVIQDDIVDVCIDGRRTIAGRYWDPQADTVVFFSEGSDVSFEEIDIRPCIVADIGFPGIAGCAE